MSYDITFKDKTSLRVNNYQGETIKEAWLDGRNVPFEIEGNAYSMTLVQKIEESKELPTALPASTSVTEDQSAYFVKRSISRAEFSNYYAKHPSYRKLHEEGNNIVIGFTWIGEKSQLPQHLEFATEAEARTLVGDKGKYVPENIRKIFNIA